jgi:hypothetical protein
MKKMLISTALATSLIASVASAETKVSAYIETTLGSGETPATSGNTPKNQGTTIGFEHGVTFSGSKELDNGMTLGTVIALEDAGAATAKQKGITFGIGNTSIIVGNDLNTIDDKQSVPVIANAIEDGNKGLGVTYNANKLTIHETNSIGFRTKTDYGTFGLNYAPKQGSTGFDDSNPSASEKTGSGLAYGFQGSLGIDGLGVNVAKTTRDSDSLDSQERTQVVAGVSYNFGNITVGAQNTSYDNVTGTSLDYSGTGNADAMSYGATAAINDQFSIGIQYAEFDGAGVGTATEEITSITAGYNLGGATITLQYHDAENVDGTASNSGEAVELRLKQSF